MRPVLLNTFTLFISSILFLLSCKKEKSCETCAGNNKPPIAIAGTDQVITSPTDSVSLDGSASNDPDGMIREWRWQKIAGPSSFSLISPASARTAAKNLSIGTYLFELLVKDDNGLSAKDTMQVTVNDPAQANRPPVANAGADQTFTLPNNNVSLNGSASTDPDNNIVSYQWTKIYGPSAVTISNSNAAQTQVTSVTQAIYLFELKVTDAGGLFSKDTVQTTVINLSSPCTNCKIVFVSNRDGNDEIYSCNGDGSGISRLTNSVGGDEQPAWSPDGSRIAFISYRTGNPELYIMNADGSNVVQKTFSSNPISFTWSPDGTKIAYNTSSSSGYDIKVWALNISSGASSLLFNGAPPYYGHAGDLTWSPDGTKIAMSIVNRYDYNVIAAINADGSGFTELASYLIIYPSGGLGNGHFYHPDWSPDGTKIVMVVGEFIDWDRAIPKISTMNANGAAGGVTDILRDVGFYFSSPSWTGDGTTIGFTLEYYSAQGLKKNVAWVSANGSQSGTIVINGWDADWK